MLSAVLIIKVLSSIVKLFLPKENSWGFGIIFMFCEWAVKILRINKEINRGRILNFMFIYFYSLKIGLYFNSFLELINYI